MLSLASRNSHTKSQQLDARRVPIESQCFIRIEGKHRRCFACSDTKKAEIPLAPNSDFDFMLAVSCL